MEGIFTIVKHQISTNLTGLKLKELEIELVQKNIKNIYLSVYPPKGRLKISAPKSMAMDTIRVFVISKLGWIRKQQHKFRTQEREAPKEFVDQESHYFNGKPYLLKVIEEDAPARVELKQNTIELHLRPGTPTEKRQNILNEWSRQALKKIIPEMIRKYEKRMDVRVHEFGVKKMKTKWGTCNPKAKRIWLNLALAKKSNECLEYVVVHEMVHLLEPSHNARFVALMNQFSPKWRFYRYELNRLPLRHQP